MRCSAADMAECVMLVMQATRAEDKTLIWAAFHEMGHCGDQGVQRSSIDGDFGLVQRVTSLPRHFVRSHVCASDRVLLK